MKSDYTRGQEDLIRSIKDKITTFNDNSTFLKDLTGLLLNLKPSIDPIKFDYEGGLNVVAELNDRVDAMMVKLDKASYPAAPGTIPASFFQDNFGCVDPSHL